MTVRRIGGVSKPDTGPAYVFGVRTFSLPRRDTDIYSTTVGYALLIEPVTVAPDMHQDVLLMEDGGTLLQEAALA